MSIFSKLQNTLDNAADEVDIYVEVNGDTYSIDKLKVTYDGDDVTEITLVVDE